jgi:hypothetical protein
MSISILIFDITKLGQSGSPDAARPSSADGRAWFALLDAAAFGGDYRELHLHVRTP